MNTTMRRARVTSGAKSVADLVLPLRAEFFNAIKAGAKQEEFRQRTHYWRTRIEGKTFERVVLTLGYPARDDHERRLVLPWRGFRLTTIQHALFGPAPVEVYAIRVAPDPASGLEDGED